MKEQSQRRSGVPDTSTTLLRDVADSQHARWAVFHSRYEPMMQAFMRERFPSLDADDIIQETFLALAKVLPRYVYNPKENGHFHNYLTGILRNKALKALAARTRDAKLKERVVGSRVPRDRDTDYKCWRESIYEIALQQLLADDAIHERTKQVFVRLAIKGEKSDNVAASLGISRETANRTKERMVERLRNLVDDLKRIGVAQSNQSNS
jgi:RNA polymerase sigma factor (sigma-70 family)